MLVLTACGRLDFGLVPDAKGAQHAGDASGPSDGIDAAVIIDGAANACSGAAPMCGPGQYCSTPVGMCMGAGTCADIPTSTQTCLDLLVCGCDGIIYGSPCAAAAAGESLASVGSQCSM